jgi:mannose-6-phosphate isomerase
MTAGEHAGSLGPLRLEPRLVPRIWGGSRFSTQANPVGEVWLVHDDNPVLSGPGRGGTLSAAVAELGEALLGRDLVAAGETRFPLLIKLIDSREWLSIQVHPDDRTAIALEGPGMRGKTEAWLALESGEQSEIIAGVRDGGSQEALEDAIRNGTIRETVQRHPLRRGDAIALPAGTIHALGPGALIYEIQQSSDITYRVDDWGRPASAGRALHIEQSIRSAKAALRPVPVQAPAPPDGETSLVVMCPYFRLLQASTNRRPVLRDPNGAKFEIVTVISGTAILEGAGWQEEMRPFDTFLLPAAVEAYRITSAGPAHTLIAQPE